MTDCLARQDSFEVARDLGSGGVDTRVRQRSPAIAHEDVTEDDSEPPEALRHSAEAPTDREIFVDLYPTLRRFAAVVDPYGDPDDLVQEALARTLARVELAVLANPGAYLRRSIVNLAHNRRRSDGRLRGRLVVLAADSTVQEPSYPSDLALLADLPSLDRSILYLVDVEGLSARDVGTMLDMHASTVRGRASRARRTLRKRLRRGGDQ